MKGNDYGLFKLLWQKLLWDIDRGVEISEQLYSFSGPSSKLGTSKIWRSSTNLT